MDKQNVLGVFNTTSDVNSVLQHLGENGYTESDVAVLTKREVFGKDLDIDSNKAHSLKSGAAEGAKKGGLVGGALGLLTGAGVLALPGIGGLLVTGPLIAALGLTGLVATTASGAATGALAGGLIGSLAKLGIDNATAERLEEAVNEGKILLYVVTNKDESGSLMDLMRTHNAEDVIQVK